MVGGERVLSIIATFHCGLWHTVEVLGRRMAIQLSSISLLSLKPCPIAHLLEAWQVALLEEIKNIWKRKSLMLKQISKNTITQYKIIEHSALYQ